MNQKLWRHALCITLCIILCIFACAAQTSLLPRYLDDTYFVCDLLLCLTLAFGICAGKAYGAFFGIFAGVLADSTGGFGICLLPLFYMLCGYFIAVCAELIPGKKFPVYMAFGAISVVGRSLVSMIYVMLSSGSLPILDVVRYVCLPIIFGTCFALPAIFPVGLLVTLPLKEINKHSIDKIM